MLAQDTSVRIQAADGSATRGVSPLGVPPTSTVTEIASESRRVPHSKRRGGDNPDEATSGRAVTQSPRRMVARQPCSKQSNYRELFLLHGFTGVRPPFDARRRASAINVSSSAKPEISSTDRREIASRSWSGARATAPVSPVS